MRDQDVTKPDPAAVVAETFIGGKLAPACQFTEALELGVVTNRKNDVTIGGLKRLVRNYIGMGVTTALRALSAATGNRAALPGKLAL